MTIVSFIAGAAFGALAMVGFGYWLVCQLPIFTPKDWH